MVGRAKGLERRYTLIVVQGSKNAVCNHNHLCFSAVVRFVNML